MSGARSAWLWLTTNAAAAGTLLVVVTGVTGLSGAHRVVATATAAPLVAVVASALWAHRDVLVAASTSLLAFVTAALVPVTWLHVPAAAVSFAAATLVALRCRPAGPPTRSPLRDYLALTKPRIMSLLLLTGCCGLFVGAHGVPNVERALMAMAGLALACGGASAFNHVLDRDIDRVMGPRTRARPVAAERIPAEAALDFGFALTAASFVLLASAVNLLTALLALLGNAFYVLVYTRLLKRRTVENIVIGGAAGAVPPVVGYAAATGKVALPALWLFLIVFFWTPPHFWSLAVLLRDHYAAARVPMLPVARGVAVTTRRIVVYTVLLLVVSFVPVALGNFGAAYAVAATILGAPFVILAILLARDAARRRAALLFHYSLLYLALLFVAMAADAVM
jgi:protoheme IX farnesyltransferase